MVCVVVFSISLLSMYACTCMCIDDCERDFPLTIYVVRNFYDKRDEKRQWMTSIFTSRPNDKAKKN